jgi:tetratricopeptide (TPR) repeat protein
MTLHTDPTYLRTIHDGLLSGAVHKDNASALPQGLVGMYEEALPLAANVNERMKFLEFFAVWALLKKEVSAEFVAPLLEGRSEGQIIDYIAQYSRWFNSPSGGTYVLYHERLRAFVLQKISHGQFMACNEAIINQCRVSLQAKAGDEWERYALEHLSSHLLIQAMESKDATALKALAYETAHWNRQVEISKGFEWSKRMLNDMMLLASKYDDDEVIECALNKVDLHHLEQNDAPRIVELVAQNDMETALQRIEAFGGNDQEGLQRKFILYMLCLMELTLLGSKDKPFRNEAIEKLLKHLDDNLPVDHSVLNWNDFFPSYLMFQLACELGDLGLDYLIVYKRTNAWESDWIAKKGPYRASQFELLLASAEGIIKENWKTSALFSISIEYANQGHIEEALSWVRGINDLLIRVIALARISTLLAKQNQVKKAFYFMQEAFSCAIKSERSKSESLQNISIELAKQGQIEEALSCAREISHALDKCHALVSIANELVKRSNLDEAVSLMLESFTCVQEISGERWPVRMSSALVSISTELARLGQIKESSFAMEEAISCVSGLSNEINKARAWVTIITEMVKQGKVEESLSFARGMRHEKNNALISISSELAKLGMFEESLDCALGIRDFYSQSVVYVAISSEMANQGKYKEASSTIKKGLTASYNIRGDSTSKNMSIKNIYTELINQGQLVEASSVMMEALSSDRGFRHDYLKNRALVEISIKLADNGRVKEALSYIQGIKTELTKCDALATISTILTIEGQTKQASIAMQEALYIARGNSKKLVAICIELGKQGKLDEVSTVIQEALSCSRAKGNIAAQRDEFASIALLLAKLGQIEEALSCTNEIRHDVIRSKSLKNISIELAKQCRVEEAFKYASQITNKLTKSQALRAISNELLEQGLKGDSIAMLLEALNLVRNLSDEKDKLFFNEEDKVSELLGLSSSFMELGQLEESNDLLDESLSFARGISSDYWRSIALMKIAIELSNKFMYSEAEVIGIEIPQKAIRQLCWKGISELVAEKDGWQKALEHISNLKNQDVQKHYLKGLSEKVKTSDFDKTLLLSAQGYYRNDIVSMETLLQHYALYELFFINPSPEKIGRYNRTLNIQWAIDIKNSFNSN